MGLTGLVLVYSEKPGSEEAWAVMSEKWCMGLIQSWTYTVPDQTRHSRAKAHFTCKFAIPFAGLLLKWSAATSIRLFVSFSTESSCALPSSWRPGCALLSPDSVSSAFWRPCSALMLCAVKGGLIGRADCNGFCVKLCVRGGRVYKFVISTLPEVCVGLWKGVESFITDCKRLVWECVCAIVRAYACACVRACAHLRICNQDASVSHLWWGPNDRYSE